MTLIELRERVGEDGRLRLSWNKEDGWTLLVVKDGQTIVLTTEGDLDELFERCALDALKNDYRSSAPWILEGGEPWWRPRFGEHSGNTFGAACKLAHCFVAEPHLISKMHGALCPLVGCEEYGCWSTVAGKKTA